ncbi:CRIB domain-containing protein RIC4-like [Salvia miltiorrhiza]|uniref:CRIB domain-containing protein RIC4-like n=1 Tax=Salvia miltiorrhiza TaxID=226208 RepID=UPI0025ABA51E|nr:CRIB domain-containing protein RIC4-like [Salvia miltiorrhiza]
MIMRGRFVLIPFSIRCDSESSVALAVSAAATTTSPKQSKTRGIKSGEENLKMNNIKNQTISKATLSEGLHRLIRCVKSFSQFFVYKEEMGQMEEEMEIGFPTDVKHVTHIGLDGSTSVNNSVLKATEILSFPSMSLQQFELAMAAQSTPPL